MRRREFIAAAGGLAAAWPIAARAQEGKVWRIGFLAFGQRPASIEASQYGGFPQGMRELGHVEGKDFVIEWRFADGRPELFPGFAAELVGGRVDIVVAGSSTSARAVQRETRSIPIIMAVSTDPVGNGLVASFAHPGGNVTGLANSFDDSASKRLELLATVVPKLLRVGFLSNPDEVGWASMLKAARGTALAAGLQLVSVEVRSVQDFEPAFATLAKQHAEALMVFDGGVFNANRERLVELTLQHRLPTISPAREFVAAGGLMSYGESARDFNQRAAFYVDRIMKGDRPADLPIQRPTRFYLIINLKTAKSLGVAIPETLLATADEVIQ